MSSESALDEIWILGEFNVVPSLRRGLGLKRQGKGKEQSGNKTELPGRASQVLFPDILRLLAAGIAQRMGKAGAHRRVHVGLTEQNNSESNQFSSSLDVTARNCPPFVPAWVMKSGRGGSTVNFVRLEATLQSIEEHWQQWFRDHRKTRWHDLLLSRPRSRAAACARSCSGGLGARCGTRRSLTDRVAIGLFLWKKVRSSVTKSTQPGQIPAKQIAVTSAALSSSFFSSASLGVGKASPPGPTTIPVRKRVGPRARNTSPLACAILCTHNNSWDRVLLAGRSIFCCSPRQH